MKYKVYCIETRDGRKYIGCTRITIAKRMAKHRHDHTWLQNNAMYMVTLLGEDLEESAALALEAEKVLEFDTTNPKKGYNRRFGGGSTAKHIPEVRAHLTALNQAKDMTGENNPMFGRAQSKKSRQLIAEKALGRPNALKGIKLSESVKRRKRKARAGKGYVSGSQHPNHGRHFSDDPEISARMSMGQTQRTDRPMLGKKHSAATKAKMKAYWAARRANNT